MRAPRCIECKTEYMETGHDGVIGVVNFNDWMKPNDNN